VNEIEALERLSRSTERRPLGEILVGSGHTTAGAVEEALVAQRSSGERLGRCLLRLGHVSENALLASLADQLRLELVDLAALDVPRDATRALPVEFARAHGVLPLSVRDGVLRVVTSDPGDARRIEDIRLLSGLEVAEVLAPAVDIEERLAECYQVTVEGMIEDLGGGEAGSDGAQSLHDIEVMASEPTVVNLVNVIISSALRERASDIHIVPFERSLELRYRIDGILQVIPPPPRHLQAALISRIKIMADMNIAERYLPQDGHIQIQHGTKRVDIRVGTMPTVYGESVVLRLLEKDGGVQTLGSLGFEGERARRLERLVEKPYGIFLATGPTGSGKTTTLYSLISGFYTTERKILTIEDPVEYELTGVAQIPVRPARGFTFATGLRAILRQDPDVIMVGEIRDVETAEIAIRAALTGHLVLSTLHTNDAPGAVTRLTDMGIEPFLIASSLEAVLAQRLVRTICAACRVPAAVTSEVRQKLAAVGVDLGTHAYWRGAGCRECRETGYRGRTGLFELLVLDASLRDLVLARRSSAEIRRAALASMITIRQDGLEKARAGATSLDEVVRVALGEGVDE